MNCRDFEILLQLAVDGEVTPEERLTLELHLDSCLACRRKEAWIELLDKHFATVFSPSIEQSSSLADAVVNSLKTQRSGREPVDVEASPSRRRASKPQTRKKGLFSRFASSLWSRRKRKQEQEKAKLAKEQEGTGWFDASVSALQPAPTSLDGFRAAKLGISSAVSGPIKGLKLVAGAVPRKRRS
jgi:anti-sigma factor RsiW